MVSCCRDLAACETDYYREYGFLASKIGFTLSALYNEGTTSVQVSYSPAVHP